MKTYSATPKDIDRRWYIVDAEGMVLGRLASEVAKIIRGKHKPMYTPHMDTGDFVIVINASKVQVTGRKSEQKTYFSHTGYMGHEKHTPYASVMASHPERIIEKAVYGMLPKTALGRQSRLGRLLSMSYWYRASGVETPGRARTAHPCPRRHRVQRTRPAHSARTRTDGCRPA